MVPELPIRRRSRAVRRIEASLKALTGLPSKAFEDRVLSLRSMRRDGVDTFGLRTEVFAFAIEAIRRVSGLHLRRCQTQGGWELACGRIVQMQTGEGKTLTGVLATAYLAMAGRGCHVMTSNPYLASRDRDELAETLALLGLRAGCVTPEDDDEARSNAYACDVTYGTVSEIGFDFLRDRLRIGPAGDSFLGQKNSETDQVQRPLFAAIVDEADSVMIDDASTPLIIGEASEVAANMEASLFWCASNAKRLAINADFRLSAARQVAELTRAGSRRVLFDPTRPEVPGMARESLYRQFEYALAAEHLFQRDREYLVENDEIVLLSGSTGRRLTGRKWQEGLQHAVEAKENVPFSQTTDTAATITVQELLSLYQHLCGMTGTASDSRHEFRRIYKRRVRIISPHRPCQRNVLSPRVFDRIDEKNQAIVDSIRQIHLTGRPVLVGTPSVEASEQLSDRLVEAGLSHQVLNANQDEQEADRIAHAGKRGSILIATNMAGRGTDIVLSTEVCELGGLHVIATEVHTARRIDRQLIGRCSRQGQPGSAQFFVSGEDELWRRISRPGWRVSESDQRNGHRPTLSFGDFRKAQRRIERRDYSQRKKMVKANRKSNRLLLDAGFDLFLERQEGQQ